jgi:hypothetical protein
MADRECAVVKRHLRVATTRRVNFDMARDTCAAPCLPAFGEPSDEPREHRFEIEKSALSARAP